MSKGVFAVDRGIWEHPVLTTKDPLSRREAWLWLLSEAEWRDRRRKRGGVLVDLKRGQVAHSLEFLASAWRWEKTKVRRFLTRLTAEHMAAIETASGVTVITICKYGEYQRVALPTATDTAPPTATGAPLTRRQGNNLPYGRADEPPSALRIETAAEPADLKAALFSECRPWLQDHGHDKVAAGKLIGRLLKEAGEDAGLVLHVTREGRDKNVADPFSWSMAAVKARNTKPADDEYRRMFGRG